MSKAKVPPGCPLSQGMIHRFSRRSSASQRTPCTNGKRQSQRATRWERPPAAIPFAGVDDVKLAVNRAADGGRARTSADIGVTINGYHRRSPRVLEPVPRSAVHLAGIINLDRHPVPQAEGAQSRVHGREIKQLPGPLPPAPSQAPRGDMESKNPRRQDRQRRWNAPGVVLTLVREIVAQPTGLPVAKARGIIGSGTGLLGG